MENVRTSVNSFKYTAVSHLQILKHHLNHCSLAREPSYPAVAPQPTPRRIQTQLTAYECVMFPRNVDVMGKTHTNWNTSVVFRDGKCQHFNIF